MFTGMDNNLNNKQSWCRNQRPIVGFFSEVSHNKFEFYVQSYTMSQNMLCVQTQRQNNLSRLTK